MTSPSEPAGSTPTVKGRIRSIAATAPAPGDVPWWAKSIGILAILSVVLGVLAVIAVRTVTKAISSSRREAMSMLSAGLFGGGRGSSAGSFISSALLKSGKAGFVGYRLGRRERVVEHALLMVVTRRGVVPCRYPTAPSMLPLAVGDSVELSGRLYPDHTARAWRCRNLTTGATHSARVVAPWAPFAALASLCMYVYVGLVLLTASH
jgi:hypothetical protein